MSQLVERLEMAIKNKGLTFNRVERECGLGNGTIKRWNDQSPRLDKLVMVAQYLDTSLDYLVFGSLHSECSLNGEISERLEEAKRAQGLICDEIPLTGLETDLVAMFRLLPSDEREDVFDIAYLKYKKHVEKKQASIYWTYFDERRDDQSGLAESSQTRRGTA